MKKKYFLLLDDEPEFIKPILDRFELEFGSIEFVHYFQQADEIKSFVEINGIENIYGIILDLMLNLSENISDEVLKGGIVIAEYIRNIDDLIPIAFISVLSHDNNIVKECLAIPNSVFISKTDPDSMEKLIDFIASNTK